MKGRWEFQINVWFPYMYFQKWNCYFQNRIIMFCLPVPVLIYLREIYIFPGSVCLFCWKKIRGPILGIYKLLTYTWMWKLGLRPVQFPEKEYINGIFVAVWDFWPESREGETYVRPAPVATATRRSGRVKGSRDGRVWRAWPESGRGWGGWGRSCRSTGSRRTERRPSCSVTERA